MPAVVRGGRRQGVQGSPRGASSGGRGRARGGASRNAGPIPGQMAAIGRLDLSPRAVVVCLCAGVLALCVVLVTGARAERIGASMSNGMDRLALGMGLELKRVRIVGASAEAEPAVRQALALHQGMPITGLDLDLLRDQVARELAASASAIHDQLRAFKVKALADIADDRAVAETYARGGLLADPSWCADPGEWGRSSGTGGMVPSLAVVSRYCVREYCQYSHRQNR